MRRCIDHGRMPYIHRCSGMVHGHHKRRPLTNYTLQRYVPEDGMRVTYPNRSSDGCAEDHSSCEIEKSGSKLWLEDIGK